MTFHNQGRLLLAAISELHIGLELTPETAIASIPLTNQSFCLGSRSVAIISEERGTEMLYIYIYI